MVEDGHLEAEGDEGETLIKVYALYAGRKEDGTTSCSVRVQGSGGLERKFTSVHPETGTKKIASKWEMTGQKLHNV
jgi:hypothetical protein